MTFLGTIPPPLRSIIKEASSGWPVGDIYVACSGNMTIERTLRDANPEFVSHSSDVSIYTTALGRWLAGDKVQVKLADDVADDLRWLGDYLDTGAGTVATLMLATHFLADVGSEHPWKKRNVDAHLRDWAKMHEQTVEKLEANRFPVGSYDCMDVREWLDTKVPEDGVVCSFPPFDKGGYEKLYAKLDETFTWPRPTYDLLDEDGVQDVVDKITSRPRWLIGLLHERPELEEYRAAYVQVSPSARPFHVYAKGGGHKTRYVAPTFATAPVVMPRLMPGDEIGDRLTLHPLKVEEFNALRSKYLNAGIKIGNGDLHFPQGVAVDGKLIGAICSGIPLSRGHYMLISDFAVAPHDYPRLSKLVVMATLSKEHQRIMERSWASRVRSLQTAVFTNAPSSMKYRGLFKVYERTELDEGDAFKFKLSYVADMGQWTLDEALTIWKEKWGDRRTTDDR